MMEVDDSVWDELELMSRPSGRVREEYLRKCASMVEERLNVEELREFYYAVYGRLEDENRHSMCDVLDVVLGNASISALMESELE